MKFKSFLLGMLGAAAIVSCNNKDIDQTDQAGKTPDVIEGIPVHATLDFRLTNPATYAGEEIVGASGKEKDIYNAVIYIYQDKATGMVPENIAYIASNAAGTPLSNVKLTLRTTSGQKKIFVAMNPKRPTPPNLAPIEQLTSIGGLISPSETFTMDYVKMNNVLRASGANGLDTADNAPTTPADADNFIKALARNEIYGDGQGNYSGAEGMLMTNWDGPTDVNPGTLPGGTPGSGNYVSTCKFTLVMDIDSTTSLGGTPVPPGTNTSPTNTVTIQVQRAFAKISVGISAPAMNNTSNPVLPTGAGFANIGYRSAIGEQWEGTFQPWSGPSGSDPIWSVGNIAKATMPFQQFVQSSVRDPYYNISTDSAKKADWYKHYDNTRIYGPTAANYPSWAFGSTAAPNLLFGTVKTNMTALGNHTALTKLTGLPGAPLPTTQDIKFAYVPENARAIPAAEDFRTYVVIGGRYIPSKAYTKYHRAAVPGNLNRPKADSVSNYVAQNANDTLYYISSEGVFLTNQSALFQYYAWVKDLDNQTDTTLIYNNINACNQAVFQAINAGIQSKDIRAYVQGQCFYRVFLEDPSSPAVDKYNVIRNHIYSVNINKIVGPGLSDPAEFIHPGQTTALDTYVSANIQVLDWHQVNQIVDAKAE